MPASIRVDIATGEGERKLARIRGRFANYKPVFDGPVNDLLRAFFKEQFRSRGAHGGTPWAPLSLRTLEIKRRLRDQNPGYKIAPLRRSDRMYQALLSRGSVAGKQMIVTPKGMTFRMTEDYHRWMQEGTPGGRVPARPILPDKMPESFMRKLRNIVTGYVVRGEFT
jgi:hypothetical protein